MDQFYRMKYISNRLLIGVVILNIYLVIEPVYGSHMSFIEFKTSFLCTPFCTNKLHSFQPQDNRPPTAGFDDLKIFRVLVLHGKGSNGEHYRKVLSPLEQALQIKSSSQNIHFTFDYLSAPHVMSKDTVNRMEWWKLPPSIRSFQAKEYVGFPESAILVEDALSKQKYDFLLGHSQGAILASILMATSPIFSTNHPQRPSGCILNGVAWPNPFQEQLHHYAFHQSEKANIHQENKTKALFIIGKRDDVNPPEGGERVRNIFLDSGKVTVDTIYHEDGHSFPVHDPLAMEAICKWICSVCTF